MNNIEFLKLNYFNIQKVEEMPNYDLVLELKHKNSGILVYLLVVLDTETLNLINDKGIQEKILKMDLNESSKKDYYITFMADLKRDTKIIKEQIF